jgi:hypothetical protein
MIKTKDRVLMNLRTIPGVGKEISEDFWNIGLRSVRDLKDKNPEKLYEKLCRYEGRHIDRCMLYVFRCAVYYASHMRHNSKLLQWWHWKD